MSSLFRFWWLLAALLLTSAALIAEDTTPFSRPDDLSQHPAKSLSEFLTPDNRADLKMEPMAALPSSKSPQDDPDDVYWESINSPPSLDFQGEINVLTVFDGKLVVGGEFDAIDGMSANSAAAWDGTKWTALGKGIHGSVYALAVFGNKLIAGGSFTVAGGDSASNIAAWDGFSWSNLGLGTNGSVSSLTVYGGKLIVGGDFTTAGGASADRIAAWNGMSWSALGSGLDGVVSALAVYDNKLIAGGNFATAGGIAARNIAIWNDTLWSAFENNTFPSLKIDKMTLFRNKLIVSYNDGRGLVYWDGLSWSSPWPSLMPPPPTPAGFGCYQIAALAVCETMLVVNSRCSNDIGSVSWLEVSVWRDSSWSSMGGTAGPVRIVACFGDKLIASDGSIIISWDGVSESTFASRVTRKGYHPVDALTVYDNKLIAAGDFSGAVSDTVHNPAAWDGTSWSSLARGIPGSIEAFTVYNDKLIAAGRFQTASGVAADNIAAWNGSSWTALDSAAGQPITSLAVFDKDMIAGFSGRGCLFGAPDWGKGIYAWNGSSWRSIGLGGGNGGGINALCALDNKLFASYKYVTFDCEMPGVPFNAVGLDSWDGLSWNPVVSYSGYANFPWYYYFTFNALIVYDGKLVAAGVFDSVGGVMTNNIAAWDGSSWSSLGQGIVGSIKALAVYDDKLIAGGEFNLAGGVAANNIAVWDGHTWSALGSGVNDRVTSLTVYDNKLIAGGWFTRAGSRVSNYLATWTKPMYDCGDANGSGEINLVDIVYVVNWLFAGGPAPVDEVAGDYNGDGRPNIADAVYLINYIFRSGPAPCEACK